VSVDRIPARRPARRFGPNQLEGLTRCGMGRAQAGSAGRVFSAIIDLAVLNKPTIAESHLSPARRPSEPITVGASPILTLLRSSERPDLRIIATG